MDKQEDIGGPARRKSRLAGKRTVALSGLKWAIIFVLLYFTLFGAWLWFDKKTFVDSASTYSLIVAPFMVFAGGFVTFFLSQRTAKVAVLMRSGSSFNASILRGLQRGLSEGNASNIALKEYSPSSPNEAISQQIRWQENQLHEISLRHDIDAIVIRPIILSEQMVRGIENCLRSHIFVVCLDTAVSPLSLPSDLAIYPFYVVSNFDLGGELLAQHVLRKFPRLENCHVLALVGPTGSEPGITRSKSFVWRLLCQSGSSKLTAVMLSSWDRADATSVALRALSEIKNAGGSMPQNLVIYCGADDLVRRIASSLTFEMRNKLGLQGTHICYLGYDGNRDPGTGDYYVREVKECTATVDASPEVQGELAAIALSAERNGRLSPQLSQQVVAPSLIEL